MTKKQVVLFLSVLCFIGTAFNTSLWAVMTPMSTQQLTAEANAVIRGEVLDIKSYWASDRSIIFTRAKVFVFEAFSGKIAGQMIDVEYPGGEVGDLGMGISDHPQLAKNEHVLLFLQRANSFNNRLEGCYRIVGAAQGKYAIDKNGIARKGGFTVVELNAAGDGKKDGIGKDNVDVTKSPRGSEAIIDNDIPAAMLIKKIQGKEVKLKNLVEPVRGTSLSGAASDPPGLSHPMYSTHGKWRNWDVCLKVNTAGGPASGLGATLAAMNEWNGIKTSDFKWVYSGSTTLSSSSHNGTNVVYFTGMSGSSLGYSNWWTSGGYIVETDVQLRSNYSWSFGFLKAVAMHELGHSLGLNHVSDTSIMRVPITSAIMRLTEDDLTAVTGLYPAVSSLGDFDGLGKGDILLRYLPTGKLTIWLMDGTAKSSGGSPGSLAGGDWSVTGVGNFDGLYGDDLLLYHRPTGKFSIWLLNGTAKLSGGSPGYLDSSWSTKGIRDFNNDGKADLLFHHTSLGKLSIWLIDGTAKISGGSPGTLATSWVVQ